MIIIQLSDRLWYLYKIRRPVALKPVRHRQKLKLGTENKCDTSHTVRCKSALTPNHHLRFLGYTEQRIGSVLQYCGGKGRRKRVLSDQIQRTSAQEHPTGRRSLNAKQATLSRPARNTTSPSSLGLIPKKDGAGAVYTTWKRRGLNLLRRPLSG